MTRTCGPVTVAPELHAVVRVGVLRVDAVVVRSTADQTAAPTLRPEALARVAEARIPLVRAMYRRLGVDPTKTRPSSEALLRRLSHGRPWPRINTLVDLGNRCSVETQLPYGLYDVDHLVGEVVFRRGRPHEEYAGIGKAVVRLAGRPALCDARGPFGNPSSDSARTMIRPSTTRVLIVIYGPAALPRSELEAAIALTAARLSDHAAAESGRWVAPCE